MNPDPATSEPPHRTERSGDTHGKPTPPSAHAVSRRILVRCPDITLKGRNQGMFQKKLLQNVALRLRSAGLSLEVNGSHGRAYVEASGAPDSDVERAVEVLRGVAGVAAVAVARWLRPDDIPPDGSGWPLVERAMIELAQQSYRPNASFAVRIRRVDKRLAMNSQDMAIRLGNVIRANTEWERVDLDHQDIEFFVDVYPDGVYLYTEKFTGIGGLPVGTGGRVLALLSGGIDSPVAAFQMAKRGAHVDLFHLTAGNEAAEELDDTVIARLAKRLSFYSLRTRLFVAPYAYFDLAIAGYRDGYAAVLFRRFVMRTAEVLADRLQASALVTGDSLGQVASQTLENIASVDQAVEMLVFRPLIGLNKEEIITLAREIGTYDISIEPYKDCCALIAGQPRTRSTATRMKRLEENLGYDRAMIDRTLAESVCLEYECGRLVKRHTQLT